MLDPLYCRRRQRRLLDILVERKLEVAVITSRPHVYWLTGHSPFWLHETAVLLRADGHLTLISANSKADCAAADEVRSYPANRFATQRMDQPAVVADIVRDSTNGSKRIGYDAGVPGSQLVGLYGKHSTAIDDSIHLLRRRKEPDELALMRKAIDCTRAMHERARHIIEPGVSEITVYTELHTAAVSEAGEPLSPAYLGNDFVCGSGGGAPRANRPAKAGEIYILDIGPAYRGYFADNARAYAVDRKPTDVQLKTWEAITGVFPIIERMAKPGVRCHDLFDAGREHLRQKTGKVLDHHLGHGVGLFPHEYPHINPEWDDVLETGDVFTIEPGLYGPEINGGIRLENQYLVTETGVENLTPFPLALA
ncbi:M24 family metallopeptidase [Humisphaera borealis]|uniref:Aminopeptidase P family protein n=1 Tax=Humisphaera borealis TaxID=2807512 RepID=A0A7M2WXV0_9BACT|nr:Xaa-Pro peptidase family protein [Humisphaera borealis]QOV90357.1 aminopeptidase P family protein [Humisphaera borealis]